MKKMLQKSGPKVVIAGVVNVMLSSMALARTGDKLQGNWNIEVTADGGGHKALKDVLHFSRGDISSDGFVKKGYKPAHYDSAEPRFGPVQFHATGANDTGATIDWQGTALANSIEGTVTLTAKDGTKETFSFTGQRNEEGS